MYIFSLDTDSERGGGEGESISHCYLVSMLFQWRTFPLYLIIQITFPTYKGSFLVFLFNGRCAHLDPEHNRRPFSYKDVRLKTCHELSFARR